MRSEHTLPPIVWGGLLCLGLLGYWVYGWAISSALAALMLLAIDTMPTPGPDDVAWQIYVGSALGYGGVATALAVPVWLLLCLAPSLRWARAWWWALVPANALVFGAAIVAVLRG